MIFVFFIILDLKQRCVLEDESLASRILEDRCRGLGHHVLGLELEPLALDAWPWKSSITTIALSLCLQSSMNELMKVQIIMVGLSLIHI